MHGKLTAVLFAAIGFGGVFLASGCGSSGGACTIGSKNCACTAGGACDLGLSCVANKCVGAADGTGGAGGMSGMDAGTGTDAATSTDPETVCAGISAYCTKINECAPLVLQLTYGTMDKCVARFKISCKDAVSAPGSTISVATVGACATALTAATCEAVLYNQVDACNFKGKRANGEACGTDAQCTSGHCTTGSDSACGVCASQLGAGSACTENGDCMPGSICSDDAHCVLPGAGGTACSDTQPCRYGFYCRNGSCVTAQTTGGASCQDSGSCEILKGLYCDTNVQTCATIGNANPGGACGLVGTSYVACSAGSCTFPAAGGTTGVCASLAAEGESCGGTTVNSKGCQFPSRCIANHCKLPNSASCQ